MTRAKRAITGSWIFLCLLTCWALVPSPTAESGPSAPVSHYRVVKVFPHDPAAFTQGLAYHGGFLYEGTGLLGRSSLRKVELETGKVVQEVRLPDELFGEGVTVWKDRLIQLTWLNRLGLVYDLRTFRLRKRFHYPMEGWGITQDGKHLIMSDGTDLLYFLDPEGLREVRRVKVHDRGWPVDRLNELEYVQGKIWANVFPTDRIVRIDPKDGMVLGWIDLSGLWGAPDDLSEGKVLNGIAYDPENDRLWVTGKKWPKLFEIKVVP